MEIGIVLLMVTTAETHLSGIVAEQIGDNTPTTIPPDAPVPNITTTPLANYLTVIAVLVPIVLNTSVKQIFPI